MQTDFQLLQVWIVAVKPVSAQRRRGIPSKRERADQQTGLFSSGLHSYTRLKCLWLHIFKPMEKNSNLEGSLEHLN